MRVFLPRVAKGSMKRCVIIVAAGRGERMAGATDCAKQFVTLAGRPLLAHTLVRVAEAVSLQAALVLVLAADKVAYWKQYVVEAEKKGIPLPTHSCVAGGSTRFLSVRAGMNALQALVGKEEAVVAVHDGVRPLVDGVVFDKGFQLAESHGTAITALPLTDSLREYTETKTEKESALRPSVARNRDNFCLVQTPQFFLRSWLQEAVEQVPQATFTDEATALEALGRPIYLLRGSRSSTKITYPEDLAWLRGQLERS